MQATSPDPKAQHLRLFSTLRLKTNSLGEKLELRSETGSLLRQQR